MFTPRFPLPRRDSLLCRPRAKNTSQMERFFRLLRASASTSTSRWRWPSRHGPRWMLTDGGDGSDNLAELELVEDGSLTGGVETDHKNT